MWSLPIHKSRPRSNRDYLGLSDLSSTFRTRPFYHEPVVEVWAAVEFVWPAATSAGTRRSVPRRPATERPPSRRLRGRPWTRWGSRERERRGRGRGSVRRGQVAGQCRGWRCSQWSSGRQGRTKTIDEPKSSSPSSSHWNSLPPDVISLAISKDVKSDEVDIYKKWLTFSLTTPIDTADVNSFVSSVCTSCKYRVRFHNKRTINHCHHHHHQQQQQHQQHHHHRHPIIIKSRITHCARRQVPEKGYIDPNSQ